MFLDLKNRAFPALGQQILPPFDETGIHPDILRKVLGRKQIDAFLPISFPLAERAGECLPLDVDIEGEQTGLAALPRSQQPSQFVPRDILLGPRFKSGGAARVEPHADIMGHAEGNQFPILGFANRMKVAMLGPALGLHGQRRSCP